MARSIPVFGAIAALFLLLGSIASAQVSAADRFLFEEMLKLATKGQPEAQYHVGMMYNNGIGTSADPTEAFEWFSKSAEGGDPLGAFKLGCYYAGQFTGVVEIDREKALKYKLVAAEQGYDLAQLDVGRHLYDDQDYPEAVRWWTQAANQGEPSSLYHLSAAYAQGKIVGPDTVASFRYLTALRQMPEFGSDPILADAFSSLTKSMSAAELEMANSAEPLAIKPTALTEKARRGLSEAKMYLAANMQ